MNIEAAVEQSIKGYVSRIMHLQQADGTWRLCFDNGTSTSAYFLILLKMLDYPNEKLLRQLHQTILNLQHADGYWQLYPGEKGNLSATVDAYYALLVSGYSKPTDASLVQAKEYIMRAGGLGNVTNVLSKVMLAVTGQVAWPLSVSIPLEILLLPPAGPLHFGQFSSYARVHLAPILLLSNKKFIIKSPYPLQLREPAGSIPREDELDEDYALQFLNSISKFQNADSREIPFLSSLKYGIYQLQGLPEQLHQSAVTKAEQYMLERIEPDGTLYSYATSTILMIFALMSLGYAKDDPRISKAIEGLKSMLYDTEVGLILQNSPSTVWDTALLSHALQQAGVSRFDNTLVRANAYLLSKQQHKLGDWAQEVSTPVAGGWGFSDSNTIHPDVDDTTAALRALKSGTSDSPERLEAWNRGLQWIFSMQNKDGGWPAFERNRTNKWLEYVPIDGAKSAAIDPSTADLTGRTLEFLGETCGLDLRHAFVKRGIHWLKQAQREDGSWYGRWGICYIYGTWAALTGLAAVGADREQAPVSKAIQWLRDIQNKDGGWGESCRSDVKREYAALGSSTLSHTAWTLDALISYADTPSLEITTGLRCLLALMDQGGDATAYPTGAGLPGNFYIRYESYNYIWPLITLVKYRDKFG
ncbi:squalene--hopene cyclase [Paenibacillus swuensis]